MRVGRLSSELLRLLYGENGEVKRGRRFPLNSSCSSCEEITVELSSQVESVKPQELSREKVERIKEAIRSGEYEVNPHRISEAIIREILGDDVD